jgi:hypothetical protein
MTFKEFFLYWFIYTMICVIGALITVLDAPGGTFDPNSKFYKVLSKIAIGLACLTIPGVPISIIVGLRALIKRLIRNKRVKTQMTGE